MPAKLLDMKTLLRDDLPEPRAVHAAQPEFSFDNGDNDPAAVPVEAMAQIAAHVIRDHGKRLAWYHLGGSPLGWLPLREHLAKRLAAPQARKVSADEILVLPGSTPGLDLVNAAFLRPGDHVLVEAFSYSAAIRRLERLGVRIHAVAMDSQGIDAEALEAQLGALASQGISPRLLYTIPTVQNPTGSILPLDRRLRLIELARRHGFLIFEDECYAELTWDDARPPSLFSLGADCCILLGSLSKTLVPALRLGYLAAPSGIMGRLLALKNDGGTGGLTQLVAIRYLETQYDTHVARLRDELRQKCAHVIEAFAREFGVTADILAPQGGMFVWVKLDPAINALQLLDEARRQGITFNAGPDWHANYTDGHNMIRVCFAASTLERLDQGIGMLANLSHRIFGLPARSGNAAARSTTS